MALTLLNNGFKKVRALRGGWDAWTAANGAVETKQAAASGTQTPPAAAALSSPPATEPKPATKSTKRRTTGTSGRGKSTKRQE